MRKTFLRIIAFAAALVMSLAVAVTAFAYETIPYGEQSDDVREMQSKLKAKGYYAGAVDGKFGPATQKAVRRFQSAIGIKADGKPGNKTLTALYEGTSALNSTRDRERSQQAAERPTNPRTLYYGCTGARVRALQRALRDAGCYKGTIDGVYGDLTYEAVKAYQYKKGLHADGMAGTKTIASLNKTAKHRIGTSMIIDVGSNGDEVKKVKAYLAGKGYAMSDGTEFTKEDAVAVKAWQEANGKTVTGTITETQYNAIVLGKEDKQ